MLFLTKLALKRDAYLKHLYSAESGFQKARTRYSHELNAGNPFPDENWAERLRLL
jgi:hypothetical protein